MLLDFYSNSINPTEDDIPLHTVLYSAQHPFGKKHQYAVQWSDQPQGSGAWIDWRRWGAGQDHNIGMIRCIPFSTHKVILSPQHLLLISNSCVGLFRYSQLYFTLRGRWLPGQHSYHWQLAHAFALQKNVINQAAWRNTQERGTTTSPRCLSSRETSVSRWKYASPTQ